MNKFVFLLLAACIMLFNACSPKEEDPPTVIDAKDVQILIQEFSLEPAEIAIHVGTTVTWVNMDLARHNVSGNKGEFDSLVLSYGETFAFTFDQTGEYTYFNKNYPEIKGKVTVVP